MKLSSFFSPPHAVVESDNDDDGGDGAGDSVGGFSMVHWQFVVGMLTNFGTMPLAKFVIPLIAFLSVYCANI